jgi:folate-binding Fe-S cluster repair protein YgfZ
MSEHMSDKPTDLLAWATLEARGEETVTFLQGQLSQDLMQLGESGAWALLLAPDSVVISTCFVAAVPDGCDLVVPTPLAEEALTRLKRFLLRTKCTLSVRENTPGPFATLVEQIDARWPGVSEFTAQLTPHSFGRAFVKSTISFDKGCFTGQELVGRLDARGSSVPWRFAHVKGPSVDALNEVLRSKGPEGPQGVTSSYEQNGTVYGLGFAHRTLFAALDELKIADVLIEEVA